MKPLSIILFLFFHLSGGAQSNLEKYSGEVCDGYYDSMKGWLNKYGFVK
jgi:hypothetical protein